MNFLGHLALARERDDSTDFLLGSMLPDLAGMARVRLGSPAALGDSALACGVRFHVRTDESFHTCPPFAELLVAARADLEARGVSRGVRLAASHVGVELLLDGFLAESVDVLRDYRRALEHPLAEDTRLAATWSVEEKARWESGRRRLLEDSIPVSYRDPRVVAERLVHILSRRPRLRANAGEARALGEWTPLASVAVSRRLGDLLESTREGLRTDLP